jgi:hypothetical protein
MPAPPQRKGAAEPFGDGAGPQLRPEKPPRQGIALALDIGLRVPQHAGPNDRISRGRAELHHLEVEVLGRPEKMIALGFEVIANLGNFTGEAMGHGCPRRATKSL